MTQRNQTECGPACIEIILLYYGIYTDIAKVTDLCKTDSSGTSMYAMSMALEHFGFHVNSAQVQIDELSNILDEPIIMLLDGSHYVVMYDLDTINGIFYISDPLKGLYSLSELQLRSKFSNAQGFGYVIQSRFTGKTYLNKKRTKLDFLDTLALVTSNLRKYKKRSYQLILIILLTSIIFSVIPFITRAIIDIGISDKDYNFILVLLVVNILLIILGNLGIWLQTTLNQHIGSRVKISILINYFKNVINMPMNVFYAQSVGDIIERSQDCNRIQHFISSAFYPSISAIVSLLLFESIIFYFNTTIGFIILFGSILYLVWFAYFFQLYYKLDTEYYKLLGKNKSDWIRTIHNITDIKLNSLQLIVRWSWEQAITGLYKADIKFMHLNRVRDFGSQIILHGGDTIVTFYSVYLLIEGAISFGTLVAIQYIASNLKAPIGTLSNFIQSLQMAYIGHNRIHQIEVLPKEDITASLKLDSNFERIFLSNISFSYEPRKTILKNISLSIRKNQMTVIVGESGSGKTTLLKIISGLYECKYGDILHNDTNLKDNILLRDLCSCVFEDSKIYPGTIIDNILLFGKSDVSIDLINELLGHLGLYKFIYSLENNLYTRIDENGSIFSSGQMRRILLIRAIVKRNTILIIDEPLSYLDLSSGEKLINLLNLCLNGKYQYLGIEAILVISHAAELISKADYIFSINKGYISFRGTSKEYSTYLSSQKT